MTLIGGNLFVLRLQLAVLANRTALYFVLSSVLSYRKLFRYPVKSEMASDRRIVHLAVGCSGLLAGEYFQVHTSASAPAEFVQAEEVLSMNVIMLAGDDEM